MSSGCADFETETIPHGIQYVPFAEKQIAKEKVEIFLRRRNPTPCVVVIGAHERIAEVLRMPFERVVRHVIAE